MVTGAGEECGTILTVGCGLHLSSSVWQEQPVAPGQFLSGLRDGFLPSDDEGIALLRGQDKGLSFHGANRTQVVFEGIPIGAPTSMQT